eukprot:15464529-Alexandrium_andersonii.AAC.1
MPEWAKRPFDVGWKVLVQGKPQRVFCNELPLDFCDCNLLVHRASRSSAATSGSVWSHSMEVE